MRIGFLQTAKWHKKLLLLSKTWLIAMKLRKIISFDLAQLHHRRLRKNSFLCASRELITGRIESSSSNGRNLPERSFNHLSMEWIARFFCCRWCCCYERLPSRQSNNQTVNGRDGSAQSRNQKKKCNYFNSVIRRVKCGVVEIFWRCVRCVFSLLFRFDSLHLNICLLLFFWSFNLFEMISGK